MTCGGMRGEIVEGFGVGVGCVGDGVELDGVRLGGWCGVWWAVCVVIRGLSVDCQLVGVNDCNSMLFCCCCGGVWGDLDPPPADRRDGLISSARIFCKNCRR